MAQSWAKKLYNSKLWKQCRESYISKVYGLCEECSDAGLILDHIIELTEQNVNDPNITLNHENLQFLCLYHHNIKTFSKGGLEATRATREGLMFNELGELVKQG